MAEDSVARDQLRAFIERIERLDEELKAINEDKKEIFAEAKGNGFDTKAMKIVLKERRQDPNERMELDAIVDIYRAALGMIAEPVDDEEPVPTRARAPARTRGLAGGPEEINTKAPSAGLFDPAGVGEEIDGETGEVSTSKTFEPQSPKPAAQTVPVDEPVVTSASEPEAVGSSETHPVANVEEEANGAIAVASDDPTSREADDADRQQVAASGFSGEGEAGLPDLPTNSNSVGTEPPSPPADGESDWPTTGVLPENSPATATSGEAQATAAATGASPVIRAAGDTGAQPAGGEDETAPESGAHGSTTGKPGPASAGPALALNPNCLKARDGKECKFAHTTYSCWECNSAAAAARQRRAA